MSDESNQLMTPALARLIECATQEVEPQVPAVSTGQLCWSDGTVVDTTGLREILQDPEMWELKEIFTALEEDHKNLQSLLLKQKEEHEMKLNSLEREMAEERLERKREMWKLQEAMLSALMATAIGRGKLMSDLRSRMENQSLAFQLKTVPAPAAGKVDQPRKGCSKQTASPDVALQSTNHLEETDGKVTPPVVIQERQTRTFWCFRRATNDIDVQDVYTTSASKSADLKKIAKLEERTRKAEIKKQEKAAKKAAKAEKKAKKEEEKRAETEAKKAAKEAKKAEKEAKKAEKEEKKAPRVV